MVAFLLGLVIARVTGVAHAMLTLAVGQAFYEVAFRWRELAKGDDGMSFNLPARFSGFASSLQDPAVMVVLDWSILVLVLVALTLFTLSRTGQIAAAIRDNEERARFIGYSTTVPRALVYAIARLHSAAIAGVLQATYNGYIAPQMFHWSLSGFALIMSIIGGAKFVIGPAIGAIVLFYIKDLAGQVAEYWPAIVGSILVIVTLTMPRGIIGLIRDLWRRKERRLTNSRLRALV